MPRYTGCAASVEARFGRTKRKGEVKYLSMNAVIRTDGPVVLTKPPRGIRGKRADLTPHLIVEA